MATNAFLKASIILSVSAFVFMFIAFASPYWYKSWTRVHSPFANIGLWHVCLSGFIMPRDPVMKSYVGCWWIHSSEFDLIKNDLQPVWFRFIQAFCIFALIADLFGTIFTAIYLAEGMRAKLYKNRPRMFFINSFLMLGSAFLVFLISLVFAEKANDGDWMPRPWMNYLSWSYGLCVVSGFFAAFAGMCLFILALIFKDKELNGDPGVTSAAELDRKRIELEKQDEAMRKRDEAMGQSGMRMDPLPPQRQMGHQVFPGAPLPSAPPHYQQQVRADVRKPRSETGSESSAAQRYQQYRQQPAYQDRTDTRKPRSETGSQSSTRVGESFV